MINSKLTMLTDEQIEINKDEIISLLRSTKREGVDSVIDYLIKSNFFYIHSSIHRHHNWRGGLAEHSLGVYNIAKNDADGLPRDSVIIAALLHDICKARMLKLDFNGNPVRRKIHIFGHGRRSVKIIEDVCHFILTDDERRAIRWHMGGKHAHSYDLHDVKIARNSKLWKIVNAADRQDAAKGWRKCKPNVYNSMGV